MWEVSEGSSRRVLLDVSELLKFLVPFFRESIFTLLSLRETWKGETSMNKGVIQVDVGGQPPIPTSSHTIFILAILFLSFWVLNFWGRFEALNNIFGACHTHSVNQVRV